MSQKLETELHREILISEYLISQTVENMAKEIAQKYQGQRLLVVGVLTGAFIFTSDLVRELHRAGLTDLEVDFVKISSYGTNTESSRNPHLDKDMDIDVSDRAVLIVEDIVETGYSLYGLQQLLAARGAKSVETAVLLQKTGKLEVPVDLNYIGFDVVEWVEGYGLDTTQSGRANPNIVSVTK